MFHYYATILILDHQCLLVFLLDIICFFRFFFIVLICKCLWIILLSIFWNPPNFIANFIANQIASWFSCFLNCSFLKSFKWICSRFFSMITNFLAIFTGYVFLIFLSIFLPIFLAKGKNPYPFTYIQSPGWTECCVIFYILHLYFNNFSDVHFILYLWRFRILISKPYFNIQKFRIKYL